MKVNIVREVFNGISEEIGKNSSYSDQTCDAIRQYYQDAGLLSQSKYQFFITKYVNVFEQYCFSLLQKFPNPNACTIVDLGTGTGTHAIILAALGFKVIGLDANTYNQHVIEERSQYWSKVLNVDISISFVGGDVFDFDYSSIDQINSVMSVFAFNIMQPSLKLLRLIDQNLASNCSIFIQDGNQQSLFNKALTSRHRDALKPRELEAYFKNLGFEVKCNGNCAIPPFMFRFFGNSARSLNLILENNLHIATAYKLIAYR